MDEKLIDQLYSEALSRGYKKGKNEFLSLMKSDDMAYEDMFSYAQSKGLVSDATQFGSMIGRFQAPYKKKEEPTTVGLPQGMVQFPQQKAPEVQPRTSPTPVGRGAQRQQAVERAAMALPSVDGLSVSAETEPIIKPSVGIVSESTAVPKVDVKAIQAQKAAEKKIVDETPKETPYFGGALGTVLSAIDSEYSPIGAVGVGDFIDDMGRSIASGLNQGDIVTPSNALLLLGKNASQDQIKKYIAAAKDYEKIGASDEMMRFSKTYQDEGKTVYGFLKGLAENPGVVGELIVSSVTAMINPSSLAAAGAVTGGFAASGATAGGIGAGAGALASVPWAIGAAGTALETGLTFSELLNEKLNERGLEFTEENVRAILEDDKTVNEIRTKSIARGATIGAIDALTGRLAGKVGAKLVGNTAASRVKAGLAGAGIEMVGGSAGEAAGRVVAGQELDVAEIGLEGISEGPMAISDIASEVLRRPIYKVNGERRTESDIESIINTASPDDLYKIDIDIKNDVKGYKKRIQDIVVDNEMKKEIKQANPSLDDETVSTLLGLEKELKTFENNKTQSGKDRAAAIRSEIKTIQQDAVQKQAAGEVPVQPTTRISEQMAEGEPQAEPQGVTAEGVQETVTAPLTQEEVTRKNNLQEALANPDKENGTVIIGESVINIEDAQKELDALNQKVIPLSEQQIIQKQKDEQATKSGPIAGNRLFNKPLERASEIANRYYERVFNAKRPKYYGTRKLDEARGKRIADAYMRMKDDPTNEEVRAAYEALSKETLDQYKELIDSGFTIEINNEEPYSNSQEMIDDLRENNRIKIFSTESGFGSAGITEEQRQRNPLLKDSGFKDPKGNMLLVNDVFRAIHDFYGHSELGNSFGPKGEENAWNVHARMFSPLARRAMTTETRGQNSFVNFSGVNERIDKLRQEARKLRDKGDEDGARAIVDKIYQEGLFAEQKIGLLPEEFSEIDEKDLGDIDLVERKAYTTVKEQKGVSISNESMMEDVESRAQKDERVKSVIAAAKKVLKTLQSVIPNAQIYLHENGSDYDAFAESLGSKVKSRGIFTQIISPDGSRIVRIDINLSNASPTTVYHEVAHAVMSAAFGENPKLFSKFRDQLTTVLSESTVKRLNEFASQYREEKSYEEWLVQFSALMSDQGRLIPVSTFQKIAQVVNKIVSQITNGAIVPFKETVSKKEVIDFFNQMSESIRLGREISISKTAESAQIKESVKEQAAQEGKPVSELPGYDKLMRDVTDTLIPNALKRKLTGQEMIDLVKRFVSKSDISKQADDIQRDELVRQVNGMLGEAYKKPPTVQKLLGTLNDVTKITITEKQALENQIKSLARGAKNMKTAWTKATGELTKGIKDLVRTGKITVKQASAVLRRFSAVNVLDDKSVSNFVEYMDKVFKNAEYADKIAGIRKSLSKAKKNIETKLGISEDLKPMLRQMLAINPNLIPMDVLDSYVDLVNMLSERAAVLDLADVSEVTKDTANIIEAVEEEQFKAEELKEMFDDFQNKELDDDGNVDFAKTINKMIDAGVISTSDAEIMRKYKSTIIPTEVKMPMTDQEIAAEKKQLQDFVQDSQIDTSNLPSRAERDAANRLAELVQTKGLESLDNQQLKNLLRVINNINNGFFPHYAQRMIEKISSANSGTELASAAQNAKPLSFSKMYSKVKNLIANDKNAFVTMIARNPLYYIDQVFGDFKTKTIYKNLFEPISKAYARFSTESNNNSKRLDKALNDVSASFKDKPSDVRLSKYKIMTYLLQLEYNSNPEVKGVAPAIDFINKTIKAIQSGETNFNDYDVETLQQIVDDFAVNGQIDMKKIEDSFNDAELKAIKTIQDINKDLSDKASYTANVIRGEKFVPINNYIHHSVISDGRAKDDLSGQTIIEAFSSSRMPSSRAKSLIERTPKAKAINFDPFNVTNFVSRSQLMDYYLTEPIRTGRMAINGMKDGVKGKQAREIANAIGKSYEQALENVLVSSFGKTTAIDDAINYLSTQGYRAVLAGSSRFLAELTSNLSFLVSRGANMFAEGVKLRDIVFSSEGVAVMNNLKSAQTNRVYSDNTLTGTMIDPNMLKHAAGIKNTKSKGDVANAVNQIYTSLIKKKIQNPIEVAADALISTPDKVVTRPVWFGSFSLEFKNITGVDPDFNKIAANDETYMNANKDALQSATDKADRDVTFMSATDNPFMGILKGRDMQNQSTTAKAFNRFNNYMTRFVTYEYITARTGINALMGNGDISRKQGAALIGAVTSRMVVYSLLTQMLGNGLLSMFGEDDDEENDKSFAQKLGQAVASSATALVIGRDFGNSVRTVMNYGIEEVNKRYLDFLREGDYDPYKDAIQFTIVPPDKEGARPDANKKIVDLITSTLGPLAPAAKTGALIARKALEAPKKTEEAQERREKEIGIRIPLEILGNVGLIPLYKDVRKIVLKEIYKDLDKSSSEADIKRAKERILLQGYPTRSDMKRYDKELYENTFGPGGLEEMMMPENKIKEEIKKQKRKIETQMKDEMYNYTPKKKGKGFGSEEFGEEEEQPRRKKQGGFGSSKFGE